MRWIVSALTVTGFSLTAGGLISAFFSARRRIAVEAGRVKEMRRLAAEEAAEMKARTPDEERSPLFSSAIHARYDGLYAESGLFRPSKGNLAHMPALEAQRLLRLVFQSSRLDLGWAGLGLLLSTVASVWSLWLPELSFAGS